MSAPFTRRRFCLGLGLVAGAVAAPAALADSAVHSGIDIDEFGIVPDSGLDQSRILNLAVQEAARRGRPLILPAGSYQISNLSIPSNASIVGQPGATVLQVVGPGLTLIESRNVSLRNLVVECISHQAAADEGLVHCLDSTQLQLIQLHVRGRQTNALRLHQCSGLVEGCRIEGARHAGIFASNSRDLTIANNIVSHCGDNGILVWRMEDKGHDGTVVSGNRIRAIGAESGGNGQNGNAINIFRANDCMVSGNQIEDCAFSGIRVNNADNAQITANRMRKLGEVALFVEFGATGAVVAQNIIEDAAAGISITNADHNGRFAVVQGNIIRDLKQHSDINPDLKAPYGIAAEFDTTINANLVEGTPGGTGIRLGWGPYCRNLVATANVLKSCRHGVEVSIARGAEQAVIRGNSFADMSEAAIVGMAWDRRVTEDLIANGHGLHHIAGNVIT